MNDDLFSEHLGLGSNNHPNPMFDFLTGFVPRKLKDLFRWTEYLFYNSPHIFIALTKLSDYIITDIAFETDSKELRKRYQDILVRRLRIKSVLKACARDRSIYGNSFVSVYLPFKRMVLCKYCKSSWDIRDISDYEYKWKKQTFHVQCPNCSSKLVVHLDDVDDVKTPLLDRINIIRWDPKLIDLDHNPVTGETVYSYNIPSELKEQVKRSSKTAIDSMPKEFLKAIQDDTVLDFDPGRIFHTKEDAPAGVDSAWGFPPLTATLKQFYYTQVLRKANEAIALDHLVPFRVLHPAQTGSSNDPVTTMALGQWIEETKKNLRRARRDPLHIQFSPVALGVTQMGGQGRSLLTLGEIKEAEDNIIASLGVPREFLYGGLSYTGSSVTLRMLENQLLSHKSDMEQLLQWLADTIAVYLGWDTIKTSITNFRFVDDIQQKSMLLQADAQYNIVSKRTVADLLDIDYDNERKAIIQESVDDMRMQAEIQKQEFELQSSLALQAQEHAAGAAGMDYDPEMVAAHGEEIAHQLLSADEQTRRNYLAQLQEEDFVLYAVVTQLLTRIRRAQTADPQEMQ